MTNLEHWLPRASTTGHLSFDEPHVLPFDKISIAVAWDARKGTSTTIAVEGAVLDPAGKRVEVVNTDHRSAGEGQVSFATADEGKPKPVAEEKPAADGDSPADGDETAAEPAEEPPAEPEAAAEEEEGGDEEEGEEEIGDDGEPIKKKKKKDTRPRIVVDLNNLPESFDTIAVALNAQPSFSDVFFVHFWVYVNDKEVGKGDHSSQALLFITRDSLSHFFALHIANIRAANIDAALTAVHKRREELPKLAHDEAYEDQSELEKTRRQKHKLLAQLQQEKAAEAKTSQDFERLIGEIETAGDRLIALRASTEEEVARLKADGDEEAAEEAQGKPAQAEEALQKLKEDSEKAETENAQHRETIEKLKQEIQQIDETEKSLLAKVLAERQKRRLAEPHLTTTTERTFAMIKPDAVAAGHAEAILDLIRANGFQILARKRVQLNADQAGEFYREHEGRPFYEKLTQFVSGGDVILLILAKEDAIKSWRALMGPTDPEKARVEAPHSIRALYASNTTFNAVHGSDSPKSARREIVFFFPSAIGTLPQETELRDYAQQQLQTVLVKGLTQLCKSKPADPIIWLSEWLLSNNPNTPIVSEPS